MKNILIVFFFFVSLFISKNASAQCDTLLVDIYGQQAMISIPQNVSRYMNVGQIVEVAKIHLKKDGSVTPWHWNPSPVLREEQWQLTTYKDIPCTTCSNGVEFARYDYVKTVIKRII